MGNEKSNAYWEKELPQHYNRGQIEKFIHAKYGLIGKLVLRGVIFLFVSAEKYLDQVSNTK